MADVKYDSGMENPNKDKTRDTLVRGVRTKLQRKIDNKDALLFDEDNKLEEEQMDETKEVIEEQTEEPKGLMTRRV